MVIGEPKMSHLPTDQKLFFKQLENHSHQKRNSKATTEVLTRVSYPSSSQDPAWRSLGLSGISNGSTEYTEWLPTKPTSSKDEMARGSGIIPGFLVNTPVTETVFIQRARVRNDKLRWGTTLVILVEFSKAFLNFKINGHCMAQI
ncbi:uncharacterized protein sb:cb288 isoform X2 [Erpetoichthys calabaricus]|uniref:uncharacterized protein sb:cb288 isoform X2 n=1 Tax=Erpetoichthys calabaricus TaxID=27687 RepID=UPI002233E8D4|nr:uncharacterized protein sb:cb288 isoform X2 [Erpetoichthys calabaricus]